MTAAHDLQALASDTVFALPQAGVHGIARAAREAALAFVNESAYWGKAELAMWLMGPYSQAAQQIGERSPASRPALREIDAATVERLMECARAEVLDALERLQDAEAAGSTVFAMIAAGFVSACEDAHGTSGWVATTHARRLADRVLSLFVADYLMHPADYAQGFASCPACERVDFDELARRRGICHRHAGTAATIPVSRVA